MWRRVWPIRCGWRRRREGSAPLCTSCAAAWRLRRAEANRQQFLPQVDVPIVPRPARAEVAVSEETAVAGPFCNLLHFRKAGAPDQPKLLIVAPLSGHFATLLRGTVATALADHDVYLTDWINARSVPLRHGRFGLDD